nr:unnamed protein product [Digitaria exilis]
MGERSRARRRREARCGAGRSVCGEHGTEQGAAAAREEPEEQARRKRRKLRACARRDAGPAWSSSELRLFLLSRIYGAEVQLSFRFALIWCDLFRFRASICSYAGRWWWWCAGVRRPSRPARLLLLLLRGLHVSLLISLMLKN